MGSQAVKLRVEVGGVYEFKGGPPGCQQMREKGSDNVWNGFIEKL